MSDAEMSPEAKELADTTGRMLGRSLKRLFAIIIAPFKYGLGATGMVIAIPLMIIGTLVGIATVAACCGLLVGGVLGVILLAIAAVIFVIGLLIASVIALIALLAAVGISGILAALLCYGVANTVLAMFNQMTGLKTRQIFSSMVEKARKKK